jgi:hypothetical protein
MYLPRLRGVYMGLWNWLQFLNWTGLFLKKIVPL